MALRAKDLSKKTKSSTTTSEVLILQNTTTAKTSQFPLDDVFPMLQDGSASSGTKALSSSLGVDAPTPLFVGGGFGSSITGSDKNTLIFKGLRSNNTVIEIKNETIAADPAKGNLVIDFNQSLLDLSTCSNTSSAFLATVNLASNVGATILPVANGGTGLATTTAKGVVITNDAGGTAALATAAMSTNGDLLIGGSSGPSVRQLAAGTNMTITNGDGTITLASSIGTISADLDMQNYDINLGTGWLSGDGTHEGINVDSSGKVFIGGATPSAYFTSDLNVNGNVSLGTTNGNANVVLAMKPTTSGTTSSLSITGANASGTTNGGGRLTMAAGDGDSNGSGGDAYLDGGRKAGSGTEGSVYIRTAGSTALQIDPSQTAVFFGGLVQRGNAGIIRHQNTPAVTADDTAVVTAANILTGIVTCTPTADRSKATDTAANLISGLGLTTDDDSFDFAVIILSADSSALDVTLTAGTAVTLVGNMHISAPDVADASIASGSAQFRVRRTGSAAVSLYRIS